MTSTLSNRMSRNINCHIFRPIWYFLLFLWFLPLLFPISSYFFSISTSLPASTSSSQVVVTLQTVIRNSAGPTLPTDLAARTNPECESSHLSPSPTGQQAQPSFSHGRGRPKVKAECRKEGRKNLEEGWRRLRCRARSQMRWGGLNWVGQVGWAGVSMGQQAE